MCAKLFKKVNRPIGVCWLHTSKPVWIVKYDAIKNLRADFWQAYRTTVPVPEGRRPWTIDNRAIGTERGYPSLVAAMRAAA